MRELDDIIVRSRVGVASESGAEVIENVAKLAPLKQTTISRTYFVPVSRSRGKFDKEYFEKIQTNSYYAYTRRYDETIRAQELADPSELINLYQYLLKYAPPRREYSSLTKQLSNKFGKLEIPPSVFYLFATRQFR
jgi:hypothetical protein